MLVRTTYQSFGSASAPLRLTLDISPLPVSGMLAWVSLARAVAAALVIGRFLEWLSVAEFLAERAQQRGTHDQRLLRGRRIERRRCKEILILVLWTLGASARRPLAGLADSARRFAGRICALPVRSRVQLVLNRDRNEAQDLVLGTVVADLALARQVELADLDRDSRPGRAPCAGDCSAAWPICARRNRSAPCARRSRTARADRRRSVRC